MRLYTSGCLTIAEIALSEISKLDFASCKEPTETLTSFYNRNKPTILINGGFFNNTALSKDYGNPVMDFKDEYSNKSNEGWLKNGIGIIGAKTLLWSSNGVISSARDYLSAYPAFVDNYKATNPEFNVWTKQQRGTFIGYNSKTLFCVCADLPGVTFKEAQNAMLNLGCQYAINLDGGGSSQMMYDGKVVTDPKYNRAVDNVVAVYTNAASTSQPTVTSNFQLKQCMLINNRCYNNNLKMAKGKPTGIVVHSTGANNNKLSRYVQPVIGQENYSSILADLGRNVYGNHWNTADVSVCVHAFIGLNAQGKVETYQTLPWDVCCWGVGAGRNGSYNYNPTARVQFEICEDALTDRNYFDQAMKEAQQLCAHLCRLYKLTVNDICSHKEAYYAGYGSGHSDPDHWLTKFGKDMDWFRGEVQKLLTNTTTVKIPTTTKDNQIAVGDLVTIASNATYYNGTTIPTWVKNQKWYVTSVTNDRVILGKNEAGNSNINSAVSVKNLTKYVREPMIGDIVKLKSNAVVYGTSNKFSPFVYSANLFIRSIDGNKVVISTMKTGPITGAVDKAYLIFM